MAEPGAELLVERSGNAATITLHRPDALNAITPTMLSALGDDLERLAAEDDITVVVLTGTGRAFCAGVDLKALGDRELVGGSVGDLLDVPARRVAALLSTMPAITIAKVNGFCFTGALELVLACDLAVAANEAKFGDTHAKFGLRPTWGMSARLPARSACVQRVSCRTPPVRSPVWRQRSWDSSFARCLGTSSTRKSTIWWPSILANSRGSLLAYKDLYCNGAERALDDALGYEAETQFAIDDTTERLEGFR